jgi:sugar phosphate isomerase/epimerase
MREGSEVLAPSLVLGQPEEAIGICRNTKRLNVVAYDVDLEGDSEEDFAEFAAICRLAKATKVVSISVPSAELGTPFNEEVERLRRLVDLAVLEGTRVSIKSQVGRLSQDPDTVMVLCDNVKGLGLTLDPSHYICGPHGGRSIEKLMKYVHNVHLRDTTQKELQVRVGQGEVDYGKLVNQLRKVNYSRCLCVHIAPMPEVDHIGELRKMRLLLESLI